MQSRFLTFLFAFVTLIIVLSCQSFDDVTIHAIDEESMKLFTETESIIIEYKFTKNRNLIKVIKQNLEQLDEIATGNKFFEAKVYGLSGLFYLFTNNPALITESLNEIELRNKKEELYHFIQASLEPSNSKAIQMIKNIFQKKNSLETDRLNILLAEKYLFAGTFTDSVALFDNAFTRLPDVYATYYQDMRNMAWNFTSQPPRNFDSVNIIMKKSLQYSDLIDLLTAETTLLKMISIDSERSNIFNLLIDNNFVYKPVTYNTTESTIISRKEFAYLLINFIAILEKDPGLVTKYQPEVADIQYGPVIDSSDEESYLPDVGINEYYYSAALVLIERELMELPDGEHFFPDQQPTGLEIYNAITLLNRLYE